MIIFIITALITTGAFLHIYTLGYERGHYDGFNSAPALVKQRDALIEAHIKAHLDRKD